MTFIISKRVIYIILASQRKSRPAMPTHIRQSKYYAKRKGIELRRRLVLAILAIFGSMAADAADVQGVLTDWNCTQRMVKDGREKTLKNDPGCSLMKNYNRSAYGLITSDKKYYRLDDAGNNIARVLLRNTPHKDNLIVVVSGEIQGDTIKVTNMTMM